MLSTPQRTCGKADLVLNFPLAVHFHRNSSAPVPLISTVCTAVQSLRNCTTTSTVSSPATSRTHALCRSPCCTVRLRMRPGRTSLRRVGAIALTWTPLIHGSSQNRTLSPDPIVILTDALNRACASGSTAKSSPDHGLLASDFWNHSHLERRAALRKGLRLAWGICCYGPVASNVINLQSIKAYSLQKCFL
jgi:hypothetical protein